MRALAAWLVVMLTPVAGAAAGAPADEGTDPASVRGVFAYAQSPHFGSGRVADPLAAAEAERVLEVVERDYVAGLTYYVAWGDLEPRPGEYRWALVDAVLEAVAARGKTLNLGIFSRDAPAWLDAEPGLRRVRQSYRRHGSGQEVTRTSVFPLDPAYLTAYFRMVADLAAHRVGGDGPALRDHPGLGYVAVGGPSNGSGLETFVQVVPDQADEVKTWIRELSAAPDWETGLAGFWLDAVDRYRAAFPGKLLAVALSFGIETGRPADRTAKVARDVFEGLMRMEPVPAVMTLNLTGAHWWYPDADGRNVPRRILGMLETSARAGHPVGLQMIGIAYASDGAEERARPFDKAMANARDLGADWVEVWVEDLLADRGAIPGRRPWVSREHPDLAGAEREVRDMAGWLAR